MCDQANFSAQDHRFMARALQLARKGLWTARPNPMVGCVIVQDGQIVGEGFHLRRGGPHAEVGALAQAGDRARGSTVYVTLEPCAHYGLTPPCAMALIQADVKKVVAATRDPFHHVNGSGFLILQEKGIHVSSGLMCEQARALNCGYFSRLERKRPWVRVKIASSLDGRTALANGMSKWITSSAAREDGWRWRARAGAILTGSGTVMHDDPSLTVRLPGDNVVPPLRVVLDSSLKTLSQTHVRQGEGSTLYMHAPEVSPPSSMDGKAEFCSVARAHDMQGLDVHEILAILAEKSINELHVEAGPRVTSAFLLSGSVDEIIMYLAPSFLGGDARSICTDFGLHTLDDQLRWNIIDSRQCGGDMRLVLRPVCSSNTI